MTFPVRSALVVALLGALTLSASGCGGTVIDDAKAEGAIKASLERSLHEKIQSVDCPSGQEVEAGKTFSCAVDMSNGEEATAILKILNEEADIHLVGLKANKAHAGKANE